MMKSRLQQLERKYNGSLPNRKVRSQLAKQIGKMRGFV